MSFEPARCPKCGVFHEGAHIGTPLVRGNISIYHRTSANEPIAGYTLCPKCLYIGDMWLIPGRKEADGRQRSLAEKNGITIHDVRNCWKQMNCDFYTLTELKAQKVRGANQQPVVVEYNADKFIEPKVEPKEELF